MQPHSPFGGWGISKYGGKYMSAISFIELYKLPIDVDHKNVFDLGNYTGDNYYGEIYNFLNSQYQSISIPLFNSPASINRAFKNINGEMMITIPKDYSDIKDYNYALLMRGVESGGVVSRVIEKGIFYFVTGFSSDNQNTFSNTGKPTTTLKLKYDSWMNNLDLLYKYDKPQQFIQGHIKETIKVNDSYYPNSIYGSSNDITHIETGSDLPNRYKVLWMRIWMDTSEIYYKTGESYINSYTKGCYVSHSKTPILFIPYLVIDTLTLSPIYTYKWGGYPIDGSVSVNSISNILKIDLTYYPPFKYTFYNDTISIGTQGFFMMQVGNVYVKRDSNYISVCVYYNQLTSNLTPSAPFDVPAVFGYLKNSGDTPEKILSEEISISLTSLYNYTANQYLSTYNNSPIYQTYPYTFYSIMCNGSSYPIIFYKDSIKCKIMIYSEKISPYYIIKFYDKNDLKIYESKPVFVQNTGSILTGYSAYDAYLRNNGNQLNMQYERLKTNALKSAVNNVISIGNSGNINSFLNNSKNFVKNIGFDLIDYNIDKKSLDARIEDIRNSQGIFNMPSIDANSNIMQDLVLIRYFYPSNDIDFSYIASINHYFGKNMSFTDNLMKSNKKIFDYKKANNVDLPFITNIYEKSELVSSINSGITLWHIDSTLEGNFLEALKTMNKKINNPDKEV